jgi:hypothetical protein
LIERLDGIRLSENHPEPQFMAHFQIHALESLHVAFQPGARASQENDA